MNESPKPALFLFLSVPLALLVAFASITGIKTTGFYSAETLNWQAQSYGQDVVNLFLIVPCLLVSAFLTWRQKRGANYCWAGTVMYLLYTFMIYCTAVHFNQLFVVYCLVLGISFYSLLWFFLSTFKVPPLPENFRSVPRQFTGIYFIILSLLFYFLWLSEILPAILSGEIPKSVKDTGLATNVVHVLDLSVFLPAILITGILLLQRKAAGFVMAPVLLSFFVLMDITIGALALIMKQRGLEGSYVLSLVMGALALCSLILLFIYTSKSGQHKHSI